VNFGKGWQNLMDVAVNPAAMFFYRLGDIKSDAHDSV
jgi:hypothetical protein